MSSRTSSSRRGRLRRCCAVRIAIRTAARDESMRKCAAVSSARGGSAAYATPSPASAISTDFEIVGDQLEADVAVLARPACGDAADEQGLPSGKATHPRRTAVSCCSATRPAPSGAQV